MSDPISLASMAPSEIARLTEISTRGRRANRKTTSGQNK
jgi:hypothetical protein